MITQKKTANAIGGKTARACESCLKKRAKWFCSADDAFLCRACDSLVHSANELATRHKRVCLDTNPATKPVPLPTPTTPSWHQGFTKKARTPRNNTKAVKHSHKNSSQMPVVPEVGNEDDEDEGVLVEETKVQESDHMIFSVPNLDDHPFQNNEGLYIKDNSEFNISLIGFDGDSEWDVNYLPSVGFSDNELADFAADVESLLEQNEEEAAVKGEGEKDDLVQHVWYPGMKVEEEGDISTTTDHCCYFDWSIDVEREMFNYDLNDNCWKNDDQSQVSGVDQEVEAGNIEQVVVPKEEYGELVAPSMETNASNKKRRILLSLNYEEVINAWASQGCSSPWTTGHRPNFNLDHHGWPNCMGDLWPTGVDRQAGEWMGVSGSVNSGDGARKARVSRYREKRRTRLFSKKIRYEVRKLNAEKRPRLKGRFVKRTSLSSAVGVGVGVQSSSSFPYLNG